MAISLKNEDSAMAWANQADALNTECEQALSAAAATLSEVNDGGEGELVDAVVTIGNNLMSYTNQILSGMKTITGTVRSVLNVAKGIVDNVLGFIGKGLLG